jgi:hypothetical protein
LGKLELPGESYTLRRSDKEKIMISDYTNFYYDDPITEIEYAGWSHVDGMETPTAEMFNFVFKSGLHSRLEMHDSIEGGWEGDSRTEPSVATKKIDPNGIKEIKVIY